MRKYDFDFASYIKDCATRLKEVSHSEKHDHYFEVSSFDSLTIPTTVKASSPFVVAINSVDCSTPSDVMDENFYTFVVLVKGGDVKSNKIAANTAKLIAKKIKAKMIFDQSENNCLYGLKKESINIQSIAMVGDHAGVMCSFFVVQENEVSYNEDDWK